MELADRFVVRSRERPPVPRVFIIDDGRVVARPTREDVLYEVFHESTKIYEAHRGQYEQGKHVGAPEYVRRDLSGFKRVSVVGRSAEIVDADACRAVVTSLRAAFDGQIYSGFGYYPLDFYLLATRPQILKPGAYYFDPVTKEFYVRPQAARGATRTAPPVVSISADVGVTAVIAVGVFGRITNQLRNRGYRELLVETGIAIERLLHVAQRQGLVIQPLPEFADDVVSPALGVNGVDEAPLAVLRLRGYSMPGSSRTDVAR